MMDILKENVPIKTAKLTALVKVETLQALKIMAIKRQLGVMEFTGMILENFIKKGDKKNA